MTSEVVEHIDSSTKKFTCDDCGFKTNKGGVCWELFGKCRQCIKIKIPTCKECGFKANRNSLSGECWTFGLCGKCHKKQLHPRKYNPPKLCPCNNIKCKLVFRKNNISHDTGYRICQNCSIIYVTDRYNIENTTCKRICNCKTYLLGLKYQRWSIKPDNVDWKICTKCHIVYVTGSYTIKEMI